MDKIRNHFRTYGDKDLMNHVVLPDGRVLDRSKVGLMLEKGKFDPTLERAQDGTVYKRMPNGELRRVREDQLAEARNRKVPIHKKLLFRGKALLRELTK